MVSLRSSILSDGDRKQLRKDIQYVNKCLNIIKKISKDVEETHL